jgi:predicted DNA binding protein
MASGVRAELAVHGAANCPVASLSAESDEPVNDVTWTRTEDGGLTEEFRIDAGVAASNPAAVADAEPVLEVGDERVYQFSRDAGPTCACEAVEALGCPIADVRVEGGVLVLTLHLADVERLREVVADLDAVAERVEVRYLVQSPAAGDGSGTDPTLVDRGRLTDRQREVLGTAYEMGYFEYPRSANATEVADELGIGLSTLAEHLAAAQEKLLAELLVD